MDDIKSLNIGLPEFIIRVSGYVPVIIDFIEGIITNGFSYDATAQSTLNSPSITLIPNTLKPNLKRRQVKTKNL